MLTNGSFVSLKDIPTGSDEGSTRLTASTVDDSNSSDTSSGSSYNNVGESIVSSVSCQVKLLLTQAHRPNKLDKLLSRDAM